MMGAVGSCVCRVIHSCVQQHMMGALYTEVDG